MPLLARGSRLWICIPAFLGCFPRDLGVPGSLGWDLGDSRIPRLPLDGDEQLPGGKITWKSQFSLIFNGIFPWIQWLGSSQEEK